MKLLWTGSPRRATLIRLAAGVTVLGLATAACSSADSTTPGNGTDSGTPEAPTVTAEEVIANAGNTSDTSFCGSDEITLAIQDGFGVNAWSQASMAAVRSEAAKCPNVTQNVAIGEGDLQKSISQINSMVAQGADALVVIPDWGEAQLPVIKSATSAGVKVVPWGADPAGQPGTDYVSYVDWVAADAGTVWAEWMVKALDGEGKVVMLGGPAGNPVTAAQLASVVEVFSQHPGMELLTGDSEWTVTNWDPSQAQQAMGALLSRHPEIDGVISDYGTDALAAARAFQAADRTLVPIATLEANGLACLYEEVSGDTPDFELATISSRNWMGRVAARKAIAAAAGLPSGEPDQYSLPLIEDTLADLAPVCEPSYGDDFYHSNELPPDVISEYGQP